jgi:hypothetical protein
MAGRFFFLIIDVEALQPGPADATTKASQVQSPYVWASQLVTFKFGCIGSRGGGGQHHVRGVPVHMEGIGFLFLGRVLFGFLRFCAGSRSDFVSITVDGRKS